MVMLKILIVEDDHEMREFLQDVADMLGYVCEAAATGHEAVAMAREQRPALVIQDIMLPDMDGWSVAEQIRACDGCERVPVIYCSGSVRAREAYHAGPPPVSAFLYKPFDIDDLEKGLGAFIGSGKKPSNKCSGPWAGMFI